MFFHGDKMESLHKHIDPAYLPEDYGGTLPKINYSSVDWYPVLRTLDNEFKGKKEHFYCHDWISIEVVILHAGNIKYYLSI
jgi:hypothetical protein